MRRMYSEQELTNVIKKVFEEELESGALDELVSDAVDAYLVEHPVDVTALEGQDVELNSLDATGLITGGEIVEKMSGYSASKVDPGSNPCSFTSVYQGVCKNGNKLTLVSACKFTRTGTLEGDIQLFQFTIPSAVGAKLYPVVLSSLNCLAVGKIYVMNAYNQGKDMKMLVQKISNSTLGVWLIGSSADFAELVANTEYYVRIEATFLLGDNLISE